MAQNEVLVNFTRKGKRERRLYCCWTLSPEGSAEAPQFWGEILFHLSDDRSLCQRRSEPFPSLEAGVMWLNALLGLAPLHVSFSGTAKGHRGGEPL